MDEQVEIEVFSIDNAPAYQIWFTRKIPPVNTVKHDTATFAYGEDGHLIWIILSELPQNGGHHPKLTMTGRNEPGSTAFSI